MIVQVDQEIYDRLNQQLKDIPEKIPSVLRKSINNAARYGQKNMARHVKDNYAFKFAVKRINSASEFESAKGKNFQATITISGKPEPLMNFHVKKNGKKISARANVLKTSELKDLTLKGGDEGGKDLKAFVVKIKNTDRNGNESHHVGIFRRMTPEERGEQQKRYDKQAKIGKQKKSSKRNAIKQLYSTSVPQMVKNDKVYPQIESDIKEKLRESLDKHIAKVMEGL